MVVSVVGFRNMSTSVLVGCQISSKSRKLTLLCSYVGVNCRLGCFLFKWLWIVLGVVCFVVYITLFNTQNVMEMRLTKLY